MRSRDSRCTIETATVQQAQGDETLLAIGEAIVFVGRRGPLEYAPGIGEVKPVIPEICLSLALVPREAHLRNVYTSAWPVKCSAGVRTERIARNQTRPDAALMARMARNIGLGCGLAAEAPKTTSTGAKP